MESKEEDTVSLEEVEPKLKYERLSNDVQNILRKDAVSCIAFHPKLICLGTRWGVVHLFDHQGNSVPNEHLRAHTVAVNQISMDSKGEYVATCSDDGKVYVYGLYTSDNSQEISLERSVKSVAIDPYYYKLGANRRFITGDDRLMLHEKSFLSRVKSSLLCNAVGTVQNIKWCDRFVAWACDVGVRIYDVSAGCSLALIKWSRTESCAPENFPCCLCWKNRVTLLIGWVDTVRICKIEKRNSVIKDVPDFAVNPEIVFQMECYVSGIASLGSDQLVVLGCSKEKETDGKHSRPQMHILQGETRYSEIYTDNLTLRGYESYDCSDYHLEYSAEEYRFIIVCPKDVIVASPYDVDDKIDWFTERARYEEAMELVTTKSRYLVRNSLLSVGRKYLDHLLSTENYVKGADLCSKILGSNNIAWEEEVFKFARVRQLRAVSKHLPSDPSCKLHPHIYEMVLYEYLKMDPEGFLSTVKSWPADLYSVYAVINAVLEHIVTETSFKPILLESLAILYTHSKQYEKALTIYLNLGSKDVFHLIREYNLFGKVHEMIETMMDLDSAQTVSMLLEKERISPDVVVSKLQHNEYYLYMYLDSLDKRDVRGMGKKYHGVLVKLYATFAPQKLLPLLKRSDNYPIQDALNICKANNLYPEMVYLLGRIGNTKEALEILISEIGDLDQAITFCKEHDDEELWQELISQSLSKPQFVSYLLKKIGTYVDPRILVQRIEDKMEIPGLKNSLVKLMQDYNLQVSIKEGCKKIVVSDCFNLNKKFVDLQQRGVSIDDEECCGVCNQKVLIKKSERKSNVLIFNCHHSFHQECLPVLVTKENCVICHSEKSLL